MSQRDSLTHERLRELLHYDPDLGWFMRKVGRCRWREGEVAGALNEDGYVVIKLDDVQHAAHRLAWLYMTGSWPSQHIDHIDGQRSNNAFINLRDVTKSINAQNMRKARIDSTSGFLGASRHKKGWQAQLQVGGVLHYLGFYGTAEAAHAAYVAAKRRLHAGSTI